MQTALLIVLLLGLVEGLTEFLPVSSTGHLILAGALLHFQDSGSATFDIVIQLGAILAVIVAYRQRFAKAIAGVVRGDPAAIRFARNILLGFVPSAVAGLVVYKAVKAVLEAPQTGPLVVAVALIVGGVAILLIERMAKAPDTFAVEEIGWKSALAIGVVQCLSMIPGVSRSGATIMGALSLGVERKAAAEYSFFLAVPTMVAASGYDLFKQRHALDLGNGLDIAVGFVVSFIVALVVIRWFVGIVSRFGFAPFAWYRIAAGSVALLWLYLS